MIKNIFIPEKINNYYIFAKTVVGIDISKQEINFCVTRLKARTTTILNQFAEKIEPGTPTDYVTRVHTALTSGMQKIPHYDELRTALPSSVVIYKYITIPFTTREKIDMVLPFEIESMLPFPVNTAVIDFVILETNKEEGTSYILVAAVQKTALEKHLEIFNETPYNPAVVTVDMMNLYHLFNLIPQDKVYKNAVILNLGLQTTTIGIVSNGILRNVRNVQQGISHIARGVGDQLNIAPHEAMENIMRFGTNKDDTPEYATATQDALGKFWSTINFTLASFVKQLNQEPVEKVFILGENSAVKNIIEQGASQLNIPCEWLSVNTLATNKNIIIRHKDLIPNSGIMSLAIALTYADTAEFNMRKGSFELPGSVSFIKTIAVTIILTLLIVGSLLTSLIWQNMRLSNEKEEMQTEVIKELRKQFPSLKKDASEEDEEEPLDDRFESTISSAKTKLKDELEMLFKFSIQSRTSIIHYLFELTQQIDKKALDFEIEQMTINDKEIILKAHVRDEKALRALGEALKQSDLFRAFPTPETPEFTMRIPLKRSPEDNI